MDELLVRIPYSDIPGLGSSTVKGHAGELLVFMRSGKRIVAWCGRRHYYEGVGWEPVVLPVEILRRMGCPAVLLTNASGGINPALRPGDFVVVRDHINLSGRSPLIGEHVQEWGERFPDMTEVYNCHLSELLHASANKAGARTMDGVYAYSFGPCYETPAEIRAYKAQGADIVGMSTVPEATFAKACGMKVAGLSLVTNLAAGISLRALDHEEVVAAGNAAKPLMCDLLDDFVFRI
jgi:purine-nucleoside phosphorylase